MPSPPLTVTATEPQERPGLTVAPLALVSPPGNVLRMMPFNDASIDFMHVFPTKFVAVVYGFGIKEAKNIHVYSVYAEVMVSPNALK